MSKKEIVYKVLEHKETSKIPYYLPVTPPARKKLVEYFGTDDLHSALGLYIFMVSPKGKPLYASPNEYGPTITDEFGVVWTTSDIDRGSPIGNPLKEPNLKNYSFPDPHNPSRYEGIKEKIEKHKNLFIVGVIGDLWERAAFLRGQQNLFMDVYLNQSFLEELLERLTEYNSVTMDYLVKFGIDAIFLSDDYGTQKDLMISPEHWRKFIKPRLKNLFEKAKSYGVKCMLHSDGNIEKIIPDLIEIGLDILHPIQPEVMDIFKLKREYGKYLTFEGGINTQNLLPYGSPEEVAKEVEKTIKIMSKGGGYILEPGINIQADVPLENILALVETVKNYNPIYS